MDANAANTNASNVKRKHEEKPGKQQTTKPKKEKKKRGLLRTLSRVLFGIQSPVRAVTEDEQQQQLPQEQQQQQQQQEQSAQQSVEVSAAPVQTSSAGPAAPSAPEAPVPALAVANVLCSPPMATPKIEDQGTMPTAGVLCDGRDPTAAPAPIVKKRRGGESWNFGDAQTAQVVDAGKRTRASLMRERLSEPSVSVTEGAAEGALSSSGVLTASSSSATVAAPEFDQEQFDAQTKLVFGSHWPVMFASKVWADREAAVEEVRAGLGRTFSAAGEPYSVETAFFACLSVVERALEDPVAPVFFTAMTMFRELVNTQTSRVDAIVVRDAVVAVTGRLVAKMSASNARTQREACRCILDVAGCTQLGGLSVVTPALLNEALPVRPRLNLLRLLVPRHKFEKRSPMALGCVMSVAVPALHIADDQTRKAAISLVVEAYSIVGGRVQKHLQGVRPSMLKIIARKFAEVDALQGNTENANGENAAPSATGAGSALAPLRPMHRDSSSGNLALRPIVPKSSFPSTAPREKSGSFSSVSSATVSGPSLLLGSSFNASDEAMMDSILSNIC